MDASERDASGHDDRRLGAHATPPPRAGHAVDGEHDRAGEACQQQGEHGADRDQRRIRRADAGGAEQNDVAALAHAETTDRDRHQRGERDERQRPGGDGVGEIDADAARERACCAAISAWNATLVTSSITIVHGRRSRSSATWRAWPTACAKRGRDEPREGTRAQMTTAARAPEQRTGERRPRERRHPARRRRVRLQWPARARSS